MTVLLFRNKYKNMDSDSESEFVELDKKLVRKSYLITYSKADEKKCGNREDFSQKVLEAFGANKSSVKPLYWAVCKELHKSGAHHYHMCIKFDGNIRWLSAKHYLLGKNKISVHFSDNHQNYISAYRYVCKSDPNVLRSETHPDLDLINSPGTSKASKAIQKKRRQSSLDKSESSKLKCKRLTKTDVMDIIKNKVIKTETEFLALANTQSEAGLTQLKTFIANTPQNVYRELISKTWKMASASEVLKRNTQNRMDMIKTFEGSECISTCQDKQRLRMAEEVLRNNKINKYVFAEAVRDLLQNGRGKGRNILITGPTNCGKTFLLSPLTLIFKSFTNPSSVKYAFVGVQECEIMFLNDLRWTPEMIPWSEFLNLLEGQTVHLAAPKTHFAQDILLSTDMPIFATSIEMIKFIGKSQYIQGENAMMEARWKEMKFFAQIEQDKQKSIESCPRCFAELVLSGADC